MNIIHNIDSFLTPGGEVILLAGHTAFPSRCGNLTRPEEKLLYDLLYFLISVENFKIAQHADI